MLASRYDYAPSVAMVHIYILSYGKVHQPIRASHALVAKELERPNARVGKLVPSSKSRQCTTENPLECSVWLCIIDSYDPYLRFDEE